MPLWVHLYKSFPLWRTHLEPAATIDYVGESPTDLINGLEGGNVRYCGENIEAEDLLGLR
jgi:hypothetical protein